MKSTKYVEEIKEFKRIKRRCSNIVNNEFYDNIEPSDNEIHILQSFAKAESHKDISPSIYIVADYFLNSLRDKIKYQRMYHFKSC